MHSATLGNRRNGEIDLDALRFPPPYRGRPGVDGSRPEEETDVTETAEPSEVIDETSAEPKIEKLTAD